MNEVDGVIFDYGFTLSSERYFNVAPSGVENWQAVLKEVIFDDPDVVKPWMRGDVRLRDVADLVSRSLAIDLDIVMSAMIQGCRSLTENTAVKDLALELARRGVPIALVTANFDVFNEVIVPHHDYDDLFDVIVNSWDFGNTDKRRLWPIAFAAMGEDIGYHNALLIEDGEKEPRLFRKMGGHAIQYVSDHQLREELTRYAFTPVACESARWRYLG